MIILLAAHFSRGNHNVLAIISLLIPFLFFIKQKWVIISLEVIAYLAALVWLYGAYEYIQLRIATGDDWVRLLIIMGCVALYTAWTGIFLRSDKIKDTYGMNE
jgi:hypothetical protein